MTTESTESTVGRRIPETLEGARSGRADLHAYMNLLEQAVAKPVPGRSAEWAKQVHETLVELGASLERHIAITEGPGGLFEEITEAAPRLAGGVRKLAEEHQQVRDALARSIDAVRDRSSLVEGGANGDDDGREAVNELIALMIRHRQRGADLIYEAYHVDVGVGD